MLNIVDRSAARGAARMLVLMLARHADRDGVVTGVTREQLMAETRLTKSGFQYAMRSLRESGEVEYVAGSGRTRSTYRVRVGGAK
jgi:hypothetical protein